jgi:phosphate transport system substrate-binding protein
MNGLLRIGLGGLLIATLGCGSTCAQTQRIAIDGSTGVMPLAAALAKAFEERNPATKVEMGTGLGTKARIAALSEGRINIALASHGLDLAELARQGLVAHEIARVPVVFGVNAGVPITNLSERQICDIYSGETRTWKSLGGPDLPIAARTRPDSEVDAEVARTSIGCLKAIAMPEGVKVMAKGGDMARELAATHGSIGMTTMTVVEQSQGRIRALSLDGIAPTPEEIDRKAYRLVRQSFLVVRNPPPPEVARFVEFARGSAGATVIFANGAIPVR